jgi:hypothetical protein
MTVRVLTGKLVTSGTESIANAPIYPEFQHGKDMKQEKY